jgi:RimJ/RimL family protein N-acetyltransferase
MESSTRFASGSPGFLTCGLTLDDSWIDPVMGSLIFPETFETARLRLRPPRMDDAQLIFDEYAQDPEVARYMTWLPHRTVETTKQFVSYCIERWAAKAAFSYVITNLEDGELLGMVEIQLHRHGGEIGYVLAKKHWGQGIMPEAAGCVVGYALLQSTIFRVQAFCDLENSASARTLEKIGMSCEGILRRYIIHPSMSGEPRDCYLYAITR